MRDSDTDFNLGLAIGAALTASPGVYIAMNGLVSEWSQCVKDVDGLRKSILRKVAWIARHDRKLNAKQPDRNVSIPTISPDGTPNVRLADGAPEQLR